MTAGSYFLFTLVAASTVLSPGPGVVMTLSNALRKGYRGTVGGIFGVAIGALFVAGVSATSLGLLLAASSFAFNTLKFIGAAYLIYLGLKLWFSSAFTFAELHAGEGGLWATFLEGLTLQLTNPKAIFFFLSVFPQFIEREENYPTQFFILVLTYSTLVIFIHSLYAFFAKRAKHWLTSEIGSRLIKRMSGTAFVFFGVALALYEH